MRHHLLFFLFFLAVPLTSTAQRVYSLDSLRRRALTDGKAVQEAKAEQAKAYWERRAAGTNYLPKVELTGGYVRTGHSTALLSNEQETTLRNLGTTATAQAGALAQQLVTQYPDLAGVVGSMSSAMGSLGAAGDALGTGLVDAFRTDTRNLTAGAIILKQPLYMGGKIRAYDRITRYSETLAGERLRLTEQEVLLGVDEAYWQVVSLAQKVALAQQYEALLAQIKQDVERMEAEGVATRQQVLQVDVQLSDAELTVLRATDGLHLARLLLAERCGLPMDDGFVLEDEGQEFQSLPLELVTPATEEARESRPELAQLRTATQIYDEKVKIERSAFLPSLALVGGYGLSNPSVFDSFEKKFKGTWAVGVMLSVPVWNWGEGRYKVRAARAEATASRLKYEDTAEKVELQVRQAAIGVNEAVSRYEKTARLIAAADENLRVARLGFAEGITTTTDLLGATTSWLSARSNRVDAAVDIYVSRAVYAKCVGR